MPRSKLAPVREFRLPAPKSLPAEAIPLRWARDGAETSRREDRPADFRRQVIDYAFKNLDRLAALEPKVLLGDDARAIHDIRVATRRLQTAMDLLFWKPRPAAYRKIRRRLKKCRRVLSEVRNCDAIMARAEEALGRKRTARREVWTSFQQFLADRRPKSFSKAVRKLSKANLATLYLQLKRLLALAAEGAEPQGSRSQGQQGKATGPTSGFDSKVVLRLEEARRSFEKRMEACLAHPGANASHQVRIAAKRLRYLIEMLHECDIPSSSDALFWFRNIQTYLGNLHDTDVIEQMLIEMIGRPQYLHEHLELSLQAAKLIIRIRRGKQNQLERFVQKMEDSMEYERVKNWLTGLPEMFSAAEGRA